MKRLSQLLLLLTVLSFTSYSYAQGVAYHDIALSNTGGNIRAVPSALVTVCSSGWTSPPPCAPALANTLFKDFALSNPLPNPTNADANGNFNFIAASGNYTICVTGVGFTGICNQVTLSSGSSSSISGGVVGNLLKANTATTGTDSGIVATSVVTGSVSTNQVPFASSSNVLTGSPNFQYGSSVANALNLNMPTTSCSTFPSCAFLAVTNTGGGTTSYFIKAANNAFSFTNDGSSIPTHGWWQFDGNGTYSVTAGGTGANMELFAVAGVFPQGSVSFQLPPNGPNTTVFSLNQPTGATGAATFQWNATSGLTSWFPQNATSATATFTPSATGLSTVMTAVQCGTIAAGGACSNTATTNAHCVSGIATLSAGTSTITGISPTFTSSSSWFIITNDITTIANPSKGVPASGTTATFTGTGTDNIQFIGCGG